MLHVNKYFTENLKSCYALLRMQNETHDFVLVASELDEPCYAFDLNNQLKKTVVWPNVGGTMTMVNIPGTLDFLATQKFYPGFNSADCRIVRGSFNGEDWDIEPVTDFPYLHRFILIPKSDNLLYFVGCSIAKSKKFIEDWSDPGEVFVGEYDCQRNQLNNVQALPEKITMNHGFHFDEAAGVIYISGKEGVFSLQRSDSKDWQLTKIFDEETSDVFNTDINHDGASEFLSIQGFHGPELKIYNHDFSKVVYKYPDVTPFGHALWGGQLYGKNYFVFGNREGKKNLFLLGMANGEVYEELIDEDAGSSNIIVFEKDSSYYVASANNSKDEFALYQLTDGGNE